MADFNVTAPNMSTWSINGQGNPTLTVVRGHTYTFSVNAPGHPFFVKTAPVAGADGTYDTGVTNNGLQTGTLTWSVPANAPNPLYYACQYHEPMVGTINVLTAAVPAFTGPWQLAPGLVLMLAGAVALRRARGARLPRNGPLP
jgi:hypothetical protein